MALGEDIGFPISVDVSGAISNLNKFASSANGSLGSVEKAVGSLNTIAQAALAFFAGREIVSGFLKITEASSEAEESLNRMNIGLKLSGDYTAASSARFERLSSEIQKNTIYTDDAVQRNVALAKSFNITNDQTEKLIRAAVDLSAVTGQDLNSSVQILGRSYDGTAGRLNELVPGVRNLTAAQLQSGAAIDYVAGRFKGAAEAAGNTYAGGIVKAKNAFDDLLEGLGAFITQNPVVLEAIKGAGNLFRELSGLVDRNKDSIRRFVNEGLIALIERIPTLVSGLNLINKAFFGIQATINFVQRGIAYISGGFASLLADNDAQKAEIAKAVDEDLAALSKSFEESAQGYNDRATAIQKVVDTTQMVTDATVKSARAQVNATKSASDALENQTKVVEKLSKAQREQYIQALQANPVGGLFGQVDAPKGATATDKAAGIAAGGAGLLGQGAAGAGKLLSGLAASAANTIIPGIGAAVGPIIDILSQGPDKVKAMVDQFIDALPDLVANIVESIPVLITEISDKLPELIQKLVDKAPEIINKLAADSPRLITSLSLQSPRIAIAFVTSLIDNAPTIAEGFAAAFIKEVPHIVEELVKQIGGQVKSLGGILPDGGGGIKGGAIGSIAGSVVAGPVGAAIGFIGGAFGFKDGGETSFGLGKRGLSGGASKTGSSEGSIGQLTRAIERSASQNLQITLKVGEQELSRVMLQLNRQGFRTT
jgi:hypothetical protein